MQSGLHLRAGWSCLVPMGVRSAVPGALPSSRLCVGVGEGPAALRAPPTPTSQRQRRNVAWGLVPLQPSWAVGMDLRKAVTRACPVAVPTSGGSGTHLCRGNGGSPADSVACRVSGKYGPGLVIAEKERGSRGCILRALQGAGRALRGDGRAE